MLLLTVVILVEIKFGRLDLAKCLLTFFFTSICFCDNHLNLHHIGDLEQKFFFCCLLSYNMCVKS